MPYRKWAPREKNKKDDVPEISRDSAFEPTVILKMLQASRTDMFPVEGRQEDAEEFLGFILNRMNDEMIEVRIINELRELFLILFLFQLKKLVEKPKAVPKKEENGDDELNGNTEISVDDDDEWQVGKKSFTFSTIFFVTFHFAYLRL